MDSDNKIKLMHDTINIARLEKSFIKLATYRFVALFVTIVTSTVIVTNEVNKVRKQLDSMLTIGEFIGWQDQFQKDNPTIKVPNMAMFHSRLQNKVHSMDKALVIIRPEVGYAK